jgi:hypothetical protein
MHAVCLHICLPVCLLIDAAVFVCVACRRVQGLLVTLAQLLDSNSGRWWMHAPAGKYSTIINNSKLASQASHSANVLQPWCRTFKSSSVNMN